jgi:hypothetical protein
MGGLGIRGLEAVLVTSGFLSFAGDGRFEGRGLAAGGFRGLSVLTRSADSTAVSGDARFDEPPFMLGFLVPGDGGCDPTT